jgi:hypothetical protein
MLGFVRHSSRGSSGNITPVASSQQMSTQAQLQAHYLQHSQQQQLQQQQQQQQQQMSQQQQLLQQQHALASMRSQAMMREYEHADDHGQ